MEILEKYVNKKRTIFKYGTFFINWKL